MWLESSVINLERRKEAIEESEKDWEYSEENQEPRKQGERVMPLSPLPTAK